MPNEMMMKTINETKHVEKTHFYSLKINQDSQINNHAEKIC